ncbi:amidase signature domain-containing protein [Lactarius hatsudake]|nr:amidase signature domain-containing protein [Lactarius hatsudake]
MSREILTLPDLYEASITELQDGLQGGLFTSVDLVKAYLARIDEVNLKGPKLRAVIETNPRVLVQATALDVERKEKGARGPLHGIPILLKDNIATDTSDGMNTTAGSYALLDSVPPRDATVAAKLRSAGALLLGKANLSEWSNFRGKVPSGFSGRGGQATCPFLENADPSGSSSGSAIASAIGLAAASLGTETDGSIVCPASRNNIVGVKPTVGLTSRAGVIPISKSQDTVGPMTRSVTDAALVLSAIAGRDELDDVTLRQPTVVPQYVISLRVESLRGARLGVPREYQPTDPNIISAFDRAIKVIEDLGATIVDPADFPNAEMLRETQNENLVFETELRDGLEQYFSSLLKNPNGIRTVDDLIDFNKKNSELELIEPYYSSQSKLHAARTRSINDEYYQTIERNHILARTNGIDATLKEFDLDAMILPTDGYLRTPAAIAGYPLITLPLGFQPDEVPVTEAKPTIDNGPGLPFGLLFLGPAFSEAKLLGYAYAYEQATRTRLSKRAPDTAVPKTQLRDVLGAY